jgi:hypothetical protein
MARGIIDLLPALKATVGVVGDRRTSNLEKAASNSRRSKVLILAARR